VFSLHIRKGARSMPASPYDVIRPYAILAVAAFVLGFASYVALDRPALASAVVPSPPATFAVEPAAGATASATDDWNIPKKI
jgi:hypothetical protein